MESDIATAHEHGYVAGSRGAWTQMLQTCLRQLGYPPSGEGHAAWVLERESAIHALREVCGTFGDNDWPATLYLGDIIEKHLTRHLWDTRADDADRERRRHDAD